MKTRRLVYSLFCSIILSACAAQPVAPTAAPLATQAAISNSAPPAAAPTTTIIPLPVQQPQPTLIVPATFAIPILASGNGNPQATSNGVPLNCRGGPDLRWPVGIVLNPGDVVEVVGRNPDSTWWYVKDPAAPVGFCWISAEFATVSGNVSNVQVVVVTDVPNINGTPIGMITQVRISLDPNIIDMPGCPGPAPRITIAAKIFVDGPMDIRFHFEGDDIANLPEHHYGFAGPDIDDVTDSFVPPLNPGKHHIFMVVDGIDLSGTGDVATYTIKC